MAALFGMLSVQAIEVYGEESHVPIQTFFDLIGEDNVKREIAGKQISELWRDSYTPMLIELTRIRPRTRIAADIWKIVERKTGERFGRNHDRAFYWAWQNEYDPHPDYARFKAHLYRTIDRRFFSYFDDNTENATIRLDEIRWGGVQRDGIPPLDRPKMVPADQAGYLKNRHVVFGVEINGDARAYPKRILAWHEMFKDVIGGVSVNGVYCTLCGTVIVYKTEHEGTHHELGTSGFLYRSNKLMYDHATESLWNTLDGEPVVGPLVGKGIKLEPLYLVTTTWGEWKKRHPDTTVLSLDTGYNRDYGEGVAYRDYFSTDELMFATPYRDKRLKNKDEVFALRFGRPFDEPRVYDVRYLKKNRIVHDTYGGIPYVLVTDRSGATRAYESDGLTFLLNRDVISDTDGTEWEQTEASLSSKGGQTLLRLSSHRAFWFGWHAAHPNTELIK